MKIEIRHKINDKVLFACDALGVKAAVELAVKASADLIDIAADWAVKMSGKTFSEEKSTPSSDERGIKTVRVVCPLKDPQRCVTCMDSAPCDGYIHVDMPAVPSQEPLAVLADRKGFTITAMPYTTKRFTRAWNIIVHTRHGDVASEWAGDSFEFAEAKARAYLAGLPDKEEGK